MRPSRGMGIVVLVLVGVSGCAGVPQRSRTSSPLEAPTASPSVQQSGWRGWWSRLRNPAPAPASGPVTDLRIETSGRVGPEREIWPDRNRSILSRFLPSGLKPRGDNGGPTLGRNNPTPTMTAAEANRAIASLARPRKDDDFVLPVRIWGDPDDPTPTLRASLGSQPPDDDQTPPSALASPIPLPGPFMERFSTQPTAKTDEAARSTSADASRAEDVGPPPLVDQAAAPDSAPALDSPTATLASVVQLPPPPPVRPSPRAVPPTTAPTPPASPSPTTEPAKPEAPVATESAKPDSEPKTSEDAAPPPPAEHAPEAPSPTLPSAPTAAMLPPSAQAPSPIVAESQTGGALSPTLFAARRPDDSASHGGWFTKWMRPRQPEHQHQAIVYASAQGPAQLPPVLVPTSYYSAVARPSSPTPTQPYVSPTAQQAFVMPTPQSPATTSHVKKPCAVLTRLHDRLEQLRQWKHDHICKHIQSFKEGLAGKHRCQACGGTGVAPLPSAQAKPTPQGAPAFPAPQAQAQSQSLFRFGLLAEPSHVAEREQVVERVAAQGLDEASQR
ncbi:hypothetical protein [Paludisphaera borealis]|uniref:Uncharacterized protein n=1 Tax=Paludisphaera borealis TaxID=1387353 RepID=A0A1U7CV09_9BACT|nr:hypothetical protein [Paludisphaera borealis]APW62713.1 hypothetical protein BSF38_04265 [Paludisphaera borealis]